MEMRYLTLAPNYTQSALRDDLAGSIVPEEAGLSDALSDRIRDWNARYRAIIPLAPEQRTQDPAVKLIDELDEEGLSLVKAIVDEHPNFKVRYFSEGHLEYMS